jgi:prevent-host-death family protein
MAYQIVLAPEAVEDLRALKANVRAAVRRALEIHLRHEPSEGRGMAQAVRRSGVKQVPLSEIQRDLSRFLHEAEDEDIVITRNGKPTGLRIGFASEYDWLENDPRFLRRIEQARESLRAGRGVRIEDVE